MFQVDRQNTHHEEKVKMAERTIQISGFFHILGVLSQNNGVRPPKILDGDPFSLLPSVPPVTIAMQFPGRTCWNRTRGMSGQPNIQIELKSYGMPSRCKALVAVPRCSCGPEQRCSSFAFYTPVPLNRPTTVSNITVPAGTCHRTGITLVGCRIQLLELGCTNHETDRSSCKFEQQDSPRRV